MDDNIDEQVEDLFGRYGIQGTLVAGGPTLYQFWNNGKECFFVAGDLEGDEIPYRASLLAGGLPKGFPFREDNFDAVVLNEKLRWQKWQHIREQDTLSREAGLVGTRMKLHEVLACTAWMEMPKRHDGLNYIPTSEHREKWRAMRTVWPVEQDPQGEVFWARPGDYPARHGVRMFVEPGFGVRLRFYNRGDAAAFFEKLGATYSYDGPNGERKNNLRAELKRLREQVEARERSSRSLEGK
jgi:hypothetical protein